jgi:hypothetical protein
MFCVSAEPEFWVSAELECGRGTTNATHALNANAANAAAIGFKYLMAISRLWLALAESAAA